MEPFESFIRREDPLVTVVVPSYNKAIYLFESVGSALAQTYPKIEVIIVNDGSPDNTAAVAQQIIQTNPSRAIRYFEKPNGGISDARNFAIERAQGRVIMNLDGDDIAESTFVEKGIALMRAQGLNLVSCYVSLFGAETGEWIPQNYDQHGIRFNNCIPSLAMYDKELWRQIGGYKKAYVFNEDWDFFLSGQRFDLKASHIPEKLFRYRVTEGGLANNYIKDSWNQSVSLMMTSNEDLYAVTETIQAHTILGDMRQSWFERMQKQDALHPNEWLLKLWMGLYYKAKGNPQQAFELFRLAAQLTNAKNWQPILLLGMLSEEQQDKKSALELYHHARTLRPDLGPILTPRISAFLGQK